FLRGTTRFTVEGCRLNVASQLSLKFTITDDAVADYVAEHSTFNLERSTAFTSAVSLTSGQASSVFFVLRGHCEGLALCPFSLTG
ncbi:MAG: hypothetical protein Q7J80_04215, partial [Anaerolineales bacterium]|nr:hypothetical protein [Anaerolineales bacterium]